MNRIRQCPALAADTPAEIDEAVLFLLETTVLPESAVNLMKEILLPPPGREAGKPPSPMTDCDRREAMAKLLGALAVFLGRANLGGAVALCQQMADALCELNRGGKPPPLLTPIKKDVRIGMKESDGRHYAVIAAEIAHKRGKTLEAADQAVEEALKIKADTVREWRKRVYAELKADANLKSVFAACVDNDAYDDALNEAKLHLAKPAIQDDGRRPRKKADKIDRALTSRLG